MDGTPPLLEIFVIALGASALWYYGYYLISPWVWSRNIRLDPAEITPWILRAVEGDGVEIYALYHLMFLNIASAALLSALSAQRAGSPARRAILALSLMVCVVFCASIGFVPPMNTLGERAPLVTVLESLGVMLALFALLALLRLLDRSLPRLTPALAALLIAPPCFIATQPIAWHNYAYVFAPALRLVHGAPLSEIYFQYDLLLSMIAQGWMRLGLALDSFQVLGQLSYFLAILGVFLLARRLFAKRELSLLLLAALILGRIYASPYDAVSVFQVTPLRLDLWLPLLALGYRLGAYHWSLGLYCAALVVVHTNFGIIYSLAYLQLLVTLGVIAYLDGALKARAAMVDLVKRCLPPVAMIAAALALQHVLFANPGFAGFSRHYQKIGIGFTRIAPDSFYWYVPALLSATVILLFRLRKRVAPSYLTSGFLLVYCAIGNSIYFFGRSHENNILNISIVLLFLFFFLLDLVGRSLVYGGAAGAAPCSARNCGALFLGALSLVTIALSYSHNICTKAGIQLRNAASGRTIYPAALDGNLQERLNGIRQVTGNSAKLYFVSEDDFSFYYYGGYAPSGYCNPFQTWIFSKELKKFLQRLLDNGYYLVCSPTLSYLLDNLAYTSSDTVCGTLVVARRPAEEPGR